MSNIGTVRYDAKSKVWYVDIWWKNERHKIFRLPIQGGDLISCKSKEMADTLKYVINRQIDQGIFFPERFKVKKPLHLKAYAEEWIEKQKHLMVGTLTIYKQYINNYITPHLGQIFITDITEGTLEDFVNNLNIGPKSKQNIIGCLMKILHDAERHHDIDRAPKKPVFSGKNKVVDPEVIWLEPKEQDLILENLSEQYRPIIMFMMMTGCRPSEARALQWSDIKWSRNEIVFRWTFDLKENLVTVKGKRPLPVPIVDDLKILLESIDKKQLSPYVFLNPKTGKSFSAVVLGKVFKNATIKALGYSIGMAHACRTSFAQQMANSGMEISMLSRWLRHSDTKVTKRYYEFKTSSMKSAADKVRKLR